MASTEPQNKLWTVDEYRLAASSGVFTNERVELLGGEILNMSPMNPRHAVAVQLVAGALRKVVSEDYSVRVQLPITIGGDSEPEPDVAIVGGQPRDYVERHPETAELVVEISDSSLEFDRTRKRELYARAGVTTYWVMNLSARQLEVFSDLQDGEYRSQATLGPDDQIEVAISAGLIAVSALLP